LTTKFGNHIARKFITDVERQSSLGAKWCFALLIIPSLEFAQAKPMLSTSVDVAFWQPDGFSLWRMNSDSS
jgi:hypothetical protein